MFIYKARIKVEHKAKAKHSSSLPATKSSALGELAKIRYQDSRNRDYIVIKKLLERVSH